MSEKPLEMRYFQVLPTRGSQCWPLPGPLESLRMEKMRETAPTEAVGCIIAGGQEAKTEILDQGLRPWLVSFFPRVVLGCPGSKLSKGVSAFRVEFPRNVSRAWRPAMPLEPFLNAPRQISQLLSRRGMLHAGLLPLLALRGSAAGDRISVSRGGRLWHCRWKAANRACTVWPSARMDPPPMSRSIPPTLYWWWICEPDVFGPPST